MEDDDLSLSSDRYGRLWMSDFSFETFSFLFAPVGWYIFVLEKENRIRTFSVVSVINKRDSLIEKNRFELERLLVVLLIVLYFKAPSAFLVFVCLFVLLSFLKFLLGSCRPGPFEFFVERIVTTLAVVGLLSCFLDLCYNRPKAGSSFFDLLCYNCPKAASFLSTLALFATRSIMYVLGPTWMKKIKDDEIEEDPPARVDIDGQEVDRNNDNISDRLKQLNDKRD